MMDDKSSNSDMSVGAIEEEQETISASIRLLDFLEDSRETALDIFNNAIKVIENHQLQIQNLSSIGADNANINLDEYHSVFKLFKDRFPNIFKGNCYSHIFHVSVKHAHDELSIDIELTLCKFYSYFSKSAKRVEQLKAYYDFVNLEYKVVDVQRAELKLQREYTTAIDLYRIIFHLIKKLEQRLIDHYFGSKVHLILNSLKESDEKNALELQQSFESFIEIIIEYINFYFGQDRKFDEKLLVFDCQSTQFLKWEYLMDVVDLIKINDLNNDELYNEYCEIKFMYNNMKNKHVKLNESIKSYISNKNVYNSYQLRTSEDFVKTNSRSPIGSDY
ncbi:unnamed protein product [Rotaria sp. Silwood2]|nr:unnamed protein product [Rotaria sp. Silwood2]